MAIFEMANQDFLAQLLNQMQEQLNRLERKQDDQTLHLGRIETQTLKTNGRVTRAESDIRELKQRQLGGGFRFFEKINSRTLYVLAVVAALLLLLIFKVVYHLDLTTLL